MPASQALTKHKHSGNLVSTRNRSGESGCSAAASALSRRQVTSETAKILAGCRQSARHYKRADALKNAGKHKEAAAAVKQGHAARASLREQLGAIGKALPAKGKAATKAKGAKTKASPAVAEALGKPKAAPKGKPSKAVSEALGKPKGEPQTVAEALGKTSVDTVRKTKEAKQAAKPKNPPLGSKSTEAEKKSAASKPKPRSEQGEAPSSRYPEAGKEAGKKAPKTIDAHSKEGKDARAKMLEMFSPNGPKQQSLDFEGRGERQPGTSIAKPAGKPQAKPAAKKYNEQQKKATPGHTTKDWWNGLSPADRKSAIHAAAEHHGEFEKPRSLEEFGERRSIGPELHHTTKSNAHERKYERVGLQHLGSVSAAHDFAKKNGGNKAGGPRGSGSGSGLESKPAAPKPSGPASHQVESKGVSPAVTKAMGKSASSDPSSHAQKAYKDTLDLYGRSSHPEVTYKHISDHAAGLKNLQTHELKHIGKTFGVGEHGSKSDVANRIGDKISALKKTHDRNAFGDAPNPTSNTKAVTSHYPEHLPTMSAKGTAKPTEAGGASPAVAKAMGHATSSVKEEQPHQWWNRSTPEQRLGALNGALQRHTHAALTGKQKLGSSKIAIQGLKSNIANKVHELPYHKAGAMSLPSIHEAHAHVKALGGMALHKLAGKDDARV